MTLSSDCDKRNISLWASLGIKMSYSGERFNSFVHNGHEIFCQLDPCHVVKNSKSCMLKQPIFLPQYYVDLCDLKSNVVDGQYVSLLYKMEEK